MNKHIEKAMDGKQLFPDDYAVLCRGYGDFRRNGSRTWL